LLDALDAEERRVVLAHEQAHLDLQHHRYVHAAEACAAAFPFLLPLARQVRFSSERWADEAAADRVGSRSLVGRVIAKVALLGEPTHTDRGLAFAGSGVTARVEAMLDPDGGSPPRLSMTVSATTVLVTLSGASVQVHHLAEFLVKSCS
jgi:beta-lactamase regulating signal transducer with metallopeptidase domain